MLSMVTRCLVPEADDNNEVKTPEMFDSYINRDFGIPRGNDGELYRATVKWRATDDDGKPLWVETYNTITDTRFYKVEYLDGAVKTLAANVISENLLSQVDQ